MLSVYLFIFFFFGTSVDITDLKLTENKTPKQFSEWIESEFNINFHALIYNLMYAKRNVLMKHFSQLCAMIATLLGDHVSSDTIHA